jgi:hypothetical protein
VDAAPATTVLVKGRVARERVGRTISIGFFSHRRRVNVESSSVLG